MRATTRVAQIVRRRRGPVTALALAALAIGLLWATDAAAPRSDAPAIESVVRWTERGTFVYAGEIAGPGAFTTTQPVASVGFEWGAAGDGAPRGEATATLVAMVEGKLDGRAWRVREELANGSRPANEWSLLSLDGALDVPTLADKVNAATRGRPDPNATWRLVATVQAAPSHEATFEAPLTVDLPLYRLPPPEEATFERAHREARALPAPGLDARALVAGASLVALACGALALAWRQEARA